MDVPLYVCMKACVCNTLHVQCTTCLPDELLAVVNGEQRLVHAVRRRLKVLRPTGDHVRVQQATPSLPPPPIFPLPPSLPPPSPPPPPPPPLSSSSSVDSDSKTDMSQLLTSREMVPWRGLNSFTCRGGNT